MTSTRSVELLTLVCLLAGQGTSNGDSRNDRQAPVRTESPGYSAVDTPSFVEPASTFARPCRQWTLRSEVIGFRRRRVDERTFVVGPPPGNPALLRTTAWSNPLEISGRFILGRELSERTAVELVGWFENDFSDLTSIRQSQTPLAIRQPFFNHAAYPGPPVIGAAPTLVELAYQSQITSVELYLRHWCQPDDGRLLRTGLLVGPRFFGLDEQFQDYDSRSPTEIRGADPTDSVYETFVKNRMYGGELGGLLELNIASPLRVLGEVKWAGFANVTTAENRFALQDGSMEFFRASTPERRFSGLVEIAVQFVWKHSAGVELWAGYRAMYFWNMTSAPDVLSFNLLNQSKQNNELAFWVHGPTAGLLVRF